MISTNLMITILPVIVCSLLLFMVLAIPDQYGYHCSFNLGLIAGILLIITLIFTGLAFVIVDETIEYDVETSNTSLFTIISGTPIDCGDCIFTKVNYVNDLPVYTYYVVTKQHNHVENQSYLVKYSDVIKTVRLGIFMDKYVYLNERYVLSTPSNGFSMDINKNALNNALVDNLWRYQDWSNVTIAG
jgi:hypothetical protein